MPTHNLVLSATHDVAHEKNFATVPCKIEGYSVVHFDHIAALKCCITKPLLILGTLHGAYDVQ